MVILLIIAVDFKCGFKIKFDHTICIEVDRSQLFYKKINLFFSYLFRTT